MHDAFIILRIQDGVVGLTGWGAFWLLIIAVIIGRGK